MSRTFTRRIEPAKYRVMGSNVNGYTQSGIFAMHITYPDTEYEDTGINNWQMGINTNDWRQGLTVLIKTPLAASSASIAESKNVIAIDLKAAAASHGSANHTYDLGTEEATRYIAAKINSRRIKMQGERDLTKYLKAKYVRQSLPSKYEVFKATVISTTKILLWLPTQNKNGFPSELKKNFTLRVTNAGASPSIPNGDYNDIDSTTFVNLKYRSHDDNYTYVEATCNSFPTLPPVAAGSVINSDFQLIGEEPKHSIVLGWHTKAPSQSRGYWCGANMGPIVQGMGSIGLYNLVAKPMDGGNMSIPSTRGRSRSGITGDSLIGFSSQGYNRFSIEGLNSCAMQESPPPDNYVETPTVEGITTLTPIQADDVSSNNKIRIQPLEYGTEIYNDTSDAVDGKISLENGYTIEQTASNSVGTYLPNSADGSTITDISMSAANIAHGLQDSSSKVYARPFRINRAVTNKKRVTGLIIPNEDKVFDDISVTDDLGNQFIFKGGSPFGTVIKDFTYLKERVDVTTGNAVLSPSTPSDNVEPNLRLELPKPEDIPGGIFVRSGHDRVQAFSNKTWGMGGLSAPSSRNVGELEAINGVSAEGASQYDTHDRMLIFHLNRILNANHEKVHIDGYESAGLGRGFIPSGTTRLFASHRMSDHAERGSVLTQTNYGVPTGNEIPHHRIRFGRQGHSFISPTRHRGTPNFMRRQLHRSHGSSYSLMFEAETEYKHHGFGNGAATNTNARFELDTLDMKASGSTVDTGSFASDGLPMSEFYGKRMIDADGAYTSRVHNDFADYLFAPGQKHTNVEGASETVAWGQGVTDASIATDNPTRIELRGGMTLSGRRYNTGSEMMINGFIINQYLKMGGRPEPISHVATGEDENGNQIYFLRGHHEGVIRPRVATELATVPPLFTHDVELMNMAAVPISTSATVPSTSFTTNTTHVDFGLIKHTETSQGGAPDAFLCHWLAEYSHPAYFGTMREQFLTFRYRESGMPRAINYPAVNGLLLRNYSYNGAGANETPQVSQPFERMYIAQWLQNYGYNGLNAGGHGSTRGLRGANAVLMGHTTIREANGTIKLYNPKGHTRYSRGEGIGDSINPNASVAVVSGIDIDSDSTDLDRMFYILDPLAALDVSRRLPVRAWGMRGCTSAIDMLAGDPTEFDGDTSIRIMQTAGRFDGGRHDSMSSKPRNFGISSDDWDEISIGQEGHETTVPIGYIANDFTVDATPFERNIRNTNEQITNDDIGIGNRVQLKQFGMLSPYHMASGNIEQGVYDTRPTTLPISGPVLWLKADAIEGLGNDEPISLWPDSSGNNRDFSQSVVSSQPLYSITGNNFNDMPTVKFVSTDKLHRPFDSALNTKDFTIFFVGAVTSDNNDYQLGYESRHTLPVFRSGYILYGNTTGSEDRWEFWAGADTFFGQAKTPVGSIGAFNSQVDIITLTLGGGDGVGGSATQVIRHDGEVEQTVTVPFYKSTEGFQQVGVLNSASFPFVGHVAEIIQYDRVLSNAEIEQVEAYLARKYNQEISENVANHAGRLGQTSLRPLNKGLDPFIDLAQHTGSVAYAEQENSASAILTDSLTRISNAILTDYYRLTGNAFHTNMHSVANAIPSGFGLNYPSTSLSKATENLGTIIEARTSHTHELADVRQIQSDAQPRLGIVMQTENEKKENKEINYTVVGTRAASLHSDLILGYQFPVLPSYMAHAKFPEINRTTDGVGVSDLTNSFIIGDGKPTFDLGQFTTPFLALGTDTVGTDLKRSRDIWAIRQASELPAWGGVYILRKTYLTREDDANDMSVEIDGNPYPFASHPKRKHVDYIVRPVRPLKLTGFATQSQQDGWCLGARSKLNPALGQIAEQPYTRDKRYGIFELKSNNSQENTIEPITTVNNSGRIFNIDYPDANEYDVVYHLIPSANMLQHFKSDANRIDNQSIFNPNVSPRYSQSDGLSGQEKLYESEIRYTNNPILGDFSKHSIDYNKIHNKTLMAEFPTVTITFSKPANVHQVDDSSMLPNTGQLIVFGKYGFIEYTTVGQNPNEILVTNNNLFEFDGSSFSPVSSYVNLEFYLANQVLTSVVFGDKDLRGSSEICAVTPPSFVDNALVLSKLQNQAWYDYDIVNDKVNKTTLNYRGLLRYDPLDFIPIKQSTFFIEDGKDEGLIKNADGRNLIYFDYQKLSASHHPNYIQDKNGIKWNVASLREDLGKNVLTFNDMSKDSLSASGMTVGEVITSNVGYIGMRTTDAVSNLLNDASGKNIGISIVNTDDLDDQTNEVKSSLNAHPYLKQVNNHSNKYVSRESKGINTMDAIRNISQLDNRQLVAERNGILTYSSDVFSEVGNRIGIQNGPESIKVSKLFDSPNEVILVGDVIAGNEIVYVKIKDTEKMRNVAGEDGKGLVKTLRQEIPGLTSLSEARKLAKQLLARAENGAPMIYIEGCINATSINAGDIIDINLPSHGVIGKFAVFEAEHQYHMLKTNLIVAQYEKGIEGILTDIKTDTTKRSGLNKSANDFKINEDLSLSTSFGIVSVHRVTIRSVNNTGFIIGARHKNGLGKIGVRDDNKRTYPIGMSKSKRYVVK